MGKKSYLSVSFGLLLLAMIGEMPAYGAGSGFSIVLNPTGISSDMIAPIQGFFKEVESLLPSSMKTAIGAPVTVRFVKFQGQTELPLPPENPSPNDSNPTGPRLIYGSDGSNIFGGGDIEINSFLIPEIQKGQKDSRKLRYGHKNTYTLAQAVLIHEIAHRYDAKDVTSKAERKVLVDCMNTKLDERTRHASCFEAPYLSHSVSNRRDFLPVAGWSRDIMSPSTSERRNFREDRSPDPYEFKNPLETFPVNLEHFLLDPEYRCRRPLLYGYLVRRLKHVPFPNERCELNLRVRSSSPAGGSFEIDLNPSRIYQIHYLVAGPGTAVMSRWGHAMFRLIRCAPDRQVVGPDCLKDVEHHVILSFRANVSDLVIDNMKGLTGGYPSQLFVLTFADVIDEYNKGELRDLVSYPIRLDESEKLHFLMATAETYWQYRGKYKFINNNCATESFWLLQNAISDLRFLQSDVVVPQGLVDALAKVGRLDPSIGKEGSPDAKKYTFKSIEKDLNRSLDYVAGFGVSMPDRRFYFDESHAENRRQWFEMAVAKKPEQIVKTVGNFLFLENYIQRLLSKRINTESITYVEKIGGLEKLPKENSPFANSVRALMATGNALKEGTFDISSYGIPMLDEYAHAFSATPDLTASGSAPPRLTPEAALAQLKTSLDEIGHGDLAVELGGTVTNQRLFTETLRSRPRGKNSEK